jgi:hypothetical protein
MSWQNLQLSFALFESREFSIFESDFYRKKMNGVTYDFFPKIFSSVHFCSSQVNRWKFSAVVTKTSLSNTVVKFLILSTSFFDL